MLQFVYKIKSIKVLFHMNHIFRQWVVGCFGVDFVSPSNVNTDYRRFPLKSRFTFADKIADFIRWSHQKLQYLSNKPHKGCPMKGDQLFRYFFRDSQWEKVRPRFQ